MPERPINAEKLDWESCPICDTDDFENVDYLRERSLPTKLHVCKTCGFVMYNPQPDPAELVEYYRSDYRTVVNYGNITTCNNKLLFHKAFLDPLLKGAKKLRILDIGQATGYFPKYCRELGHEAMGTELTAGFVDFARNIWDIPTYETIDDAPGQFDLISFYHVLEHMTRPREHLRKCRERLNDDGLLYVSVPNTKELVVPGFVSVPESFDVVFPQQHLLNFTTTSLGNLFNRCGFEVARLNLTIYGITVLCRKGNEKPIVPESREKVEARLDAMKRAIDAFRQAPPVDTNYEKALMIYGNFPDAWLRLSAVQKDVDDQEKILKRAVKMLHLNATLWAQLGFVFFRKFKWEDALEALRYSYALSPTGNVLHHMGLCYVELGQHEKAIECFKECARDPKLAEQEWKMLGWVATQFRKKK